MRTKVRTALAAAAILAPLASVPVHATESFAAASAAECSVTLALDPVAEEGTMTGELSGSGVPEPAGAPVTGTLTCRVQVSVADHTDHTGNGPAVSGHGTGFVTAAPATINVLVDPGQSVLLCEEVVDDADGTMYFWDATAREWSTQLVRRLRARHQGHAVRAAATRHGLPVRPRDG